MAFAGTRPVNPWLLVLLKSPVALSPLKVIKYSSLESGEYNKFDVMPIPVKAIKSPGFILESTVPVNNGITVKLKSETVEVPWAPETVIGP